MSVSHVFLQSINLETLYIEASVPLLQVLAAVIKAGAAREHEILAEIRDAVFAFIRRMEPRKVMDTMLVSRVRILYIRSLLARSPELQSIKVYSFNSNLFCFHQIPHPLAFT